MQSYHQQLKMGRGLARLGCNSAEQLGVSPDKVDAEFSRLEKQESGGNLRTENDAALGAFRTLIVQFPSSYQGSSIHVLHSGAEVAFAAGAVADAEAAHEFRYLARHAGCLRKRRPVTAAARITAVYALRWRGAGAPPRPPPVDTARSLTANLQVRRRERKIKRGWFEKSKGQGMEGKGRVERIK